MSRLSQGTEMIALEQEVLSMKITTLLAAIFILASSLFTLAHASEDYGTISDDQWVSAREIEVEDTVAKSRALREELSRRMPATLDGDSLMGEEYQALMNSDEEVDYLKLSSSL